MVDARMPERYLTDRRVLRLSLGAFRAYVMTLLWAVSNRTDGILDDRDLELVPKVTRAHAIELVAAELWEQVDGGFLIVDFEATQTSRDELAVLSNARRREREKKARQRGRSSSEAPGDVPGDVSPGTAQARLGVKEQEVEPSRFCVAHPRGTSQPCGPCGDARELHSIWKRQQASKPTPVPRHGPIDPSACSHKFIGRDFDCVICGLLPTPEQLNSGRELRVVS